MGFKTVSIAAITATVLATATAPANSGGSTIGTGAGLTLNGVDPSAFSTTSPTIKSEQGKIVVAGGILGTGATLTHNGVAVNGLRWNSRLLNGYAVNGRLSNGFRLNQNPLEDVTPPASNAGQLIAKDGKLIIMAK